MGSRWATSWVGLLAIGLAFACGPADRGTSPGAEPSPDSSPAGVADTAGPLPAASTGGESFSYGCGREFRFVARMGEDGRSVRLILPDTAVSLPRIVSASGARYAAGPYVYRSHGADARLETPERTFTDCVSDEGGPAWQDAKARGVRFRAVGQEPGWVLDVRADGAIDVEADYGETVVHFPPSDPESGADAGRTVYRIETEAHRAMVVIVDESCRDAMSGWPYEATVMLDLDGSEYRGCGRRL